LRWLADDERHGKAAAHFEEISSGAKALLFKVARMVGGNKRKQSFDETLATMESAWAAGMETLVAHYLKS
jgi:hypothetical protein